MAFTFSRRVLLSAFAATAVTMVPAAQVVHAGAQPLGTILVPGAAWAGATASMGNLNVYSNGSTFTGIYQCTQLAMRWASVRYSESPQWPVSSAFDMWREGPLMPVPFTQLRNGGGTLPQFGDLIVYNVTPAFPSGHVAIVSSTGPGYVDVVEQNGSWTGRATLPINGTTMPPRAGSNQPVVGWLRAGGAYRPTPNVPGGQILDAWGGVHPFGSADAVAPGAYWSGWNIARDVATPAGHPDSGYVLDGYGGIHAFGGAPAVTITGYWPGWDIARKLVLRADGHSGYVLDGYGGVHGFGVSGDMPPAVVTTGYWPGWDIAHDLVLRSDGVSGYVLDGFGGLHAFGLSRLSLPRPFASAYWLGWNIARGVALSSDSGGYVVDGLGGIHAFGTAPVVSATAYFGSDVARGVVVTAAGGGYVVFRTGDLRPFGSAVAVNVDLMGLPLGQAAS
jgi:CHAP domain